MPTKTIVRFKVFLIDFADTRAPATFSPNWIQDQLFSSTPAMSTPDSNADPLEGTVYQFFFANTDGWLRVEGAVIPWAQSAFNNRDIPHWNKATMTLPNSVPANQQVDWGESWPVIVAEALRNNGFVSSRFPNAQALRTAILALPNGTPADRLVFLHTDVSGGGVRRSFGDLNNILQRMSSANVNSRTRPDNNQPWSTLWDNGWAGLPDFLATPILSWNQGGIRADGTYPAPVGTPTPRMEGFSILLHEFGHLALDLADYYGAKYGPWGNMCIMGGPRTETNFHPHFSSLALHETGYLSFVNHSRENHRLHLRPYETHRQAVRLTNGPPRSQEWLVLSNRRDLSYRRFQAPLDGGPGVFAYRWDPYGRTRMLFGGNPVRKCSGVVRLNADASNANVLWKLGETIGATPANIFEGPATLRNGRGELWFTLDQVTTDGDDLYADIKLQAIHLLTDYHHATWTGEGPNVSPVPLAHDRFGGPDGHVILQQDKQPVRGVGGLGLYMHPRWIQNGRVRGRYPLASMPAGPLTLYAKVGMADDATESDGVRMIFSSGSDTHAIRLEPGELKQICVDFAAPGAHLDVIVESDGNATRDWAYLVDAWLVPDAPRTYDFLANVDDATWASRTGALTVNAAGSNQGEVSTKSWRALHTGVVYFGRTMFTHVNWANDGFVRGTWSSILVPPGGAFVRGALGWADKRRVTSNGVEITVDWRTSATGAAGAGPWQTLLDKAQYDMTSTKIGPDNDLMYMELPLPAGANGNMCDFRFRVDADGSSTQDWVTWVKLALTTA